MCVCACACYIVNVWVREQFVLDQFLLSSVLVPGIEFKFLGLVTSIFYPLSHLAGL